METGLTGKKALISGGGIGIGFAIAQQLADEGVHIAIANRGYYPESERKLKDRGVKVVGLRADVSNEEEVVRMVKEAREGLGGLDLYVNNVAAHWDEAALKVTAAGWNKTVATNLSACVFGCREAGRHFIKQRSGSILIIGSTATYTLYPGEISYRVTKTALVPYLEGLAAELAPFNIRVNMITPGLFLTRMTQNLDFQGETLKKVLEAIPFHRAGDAYKELGPAAVMLLSDRLSGYTTAANLVIDGGLKMRVLPWRTEEELLSMNQPE